MADTCWVRSAAPTARSLLGTAHWISTPGELGFVTIHTHAHTHHIVYIRTHASSRVAVAEASADKHARPAAAYQPDGLLRPLRTLPPDVADADHAQQAQQQQAARGGGVVTCQQRVGRQGIKLWVGGLSVGLQRANAGRRG